MGQIRLQTGWIGHRDSSRIDGRYRLVERLGAGGMSVVWRAYDEMTFRLDGRACAAVVIGAVSHGRRDGATRNQLVALPAAGHINSG